MASRVSALRGAAFAVAALGLVWSNSAGQRAAGSQAFAALPPAPFAPAPLLRVSASDLSALTAGAAPIQPHQAQSVVAPAAAIAVAAIAASLGLSSRRSRAVAKRRGARLVVAASKADAEEDDEEDSDDEFADDDAYGFDDDEEDDFYDEDEEESLEASCQARYLKGGARHFRKVLWQIRGRSYRDALMMLEFMPWKCCKPILCAVQSAAANAQNCYNMDKARLYIKHCRAMPGPTMKRMKPVAKGQFHPFRKYKTHLKIIVAEMTDKQLARMDMS